MERGIFIGFLLVVLTLNTTHSYPNETVHSFKDLKDLDGVRNLHPQGLKLLYWLSSNIKYIDDNNIIFLHFDVTRGDYGSHQYDKTEEVLSTICKDTGTFYSLGDLNSDNSGQFPKYVTITFDLLKGNEERVENNRHRLLLRISERGSRKKDLKTGRRVDQVYITQYHSHNSTSDPDDTYKVSYSLLKDLQKIQNPKENHIEKYPKYQIQHSIKIFSEFVSRINPYKKDIISQCNVHEHNSRAEGMGDCDDFNMKPEIKATSVGTARISWSHIPKKHLDDGVVLVLQERKDNEIKITCTSAMEDSGNYDTTTVLNPGLQVLLYNGKPNVGQHCHVGKEIWRSPEFHDANGKIPVDLKGYDASLQLFVKNGKACARLYIRKSFTDWKNVFSSSWVGFYLNQNTYYNQYDTYQWVVNFVKDSYRLPNYDVYVYQSDMAMSPTVQARFMLWKKSGEMARTPYWEIETPPSITADINGYDVRLQLFVREGYACARLYIRKTFSNWKDVLKNSWVGFYTHENKGSNEYVTEDLDVLTLWKYQNNWQWAAEFSRDTDYDSQDHYAYWYQSYLPMSHGVQARFMLKETDEKARTQTWELHTLPSIPPVDIKGYDAKLELYLNDWDVDTSYWHACTRLYISKAFTDWLDVFQNSWVGFYTHENKGTQSYYTYQYVVYFSKESRSDVPDYDVYVYQSNMLMSPGVQVRFIMDNSEVARTQPW